MSYRPPDSPGAQMSTTPSPHAALTCCPRCSRILSTPTMALRQAVARPLGAAVRSAGCSRSAVRAFASTALRAKEVAAESSETPNMRVRISIAAFP